MHDARPQLASNLRKGGEAMEQRVDQRAAIALVVGRARAGVDHHSRRFVNHSEIVIFVNDVERNIFGNRA